MQRGRSDDVEDHGRKIRLEDVKDLARGTVEVLLEKGGRAEARDAAIPLEDSREIKEEKWIITPAQEIEEGIAADRFVRVRRGDQSGRRPFRRFVDPRD
jgi:hypothetical protein